MSTSTPAVERNGLGAPQGVMESAKKEHISGELVYEHADYLFRYALKYYRQSEVAEDLVQETFVAALQSSSRFQGDSSVRTWLTSILRHKIIDRLRKEKRLQEVSVESDMAETMDYFFDQHEEFHGKAYPREWGSILGSLSSERSSSRSSSVV